MKTNNEIEIDEEDENENIPPLKKTNDIYIEYPI